MPSPCTTLIWVYQNLNVLEGPPFLEWVRVSLVVGQAILGILELVKSILIYLLVLKFRILRVVCLVRAPYTTLNWVYQNLSVLECPPFLELVSWNW